MFTNITRARCDRCGDVVDIEYSLDSVGDAVGDLIHKKMGWSSVVVNRHYADRRFNQSGRLALCPECSEMFDKFMENLD